MFINAHVHCSLRGVHLSQSLRSAITADHTNSVTVTHVRRNLYTSSMIYSI